MPLDTPSQAYGTLPYHACTSFKTLSGTASNMKGRFVHGFAAHKRNTRE